MMLVSPEQSYQNSSKFSSGRLWLSFWFSSTGDVRPRALSSTENLRLGSPLWGVDASKTLSPIGDEGGTCWNWLRDSSEMSLSESLLGTDAQKSRNLFIHEIVSNQKEILKKMNWKVFENAQCSGIFGCPTQEKYLTPVKIKRIHSLYLRAREWEVCFSQCSSERKKFSMRLRKKFFLI